MNLEKSKFLIYGKIFVTQFSYMEKYLSHSFQKVPFIEIPYFFLYVWNCMVRSFSDMENV